MTARAAASAAAALACALLGAALLSPGGAHADVAARAGFGGSCSSNADCSTLNSECLNGKCSCNPSDILVGGKCLVPVGARCTNRTCDADNSHCVVGHCVCKDGFLQTYNNTYCYEAPSKYNEYCEKDADCSFLSDEGRCVKNKCRCSDTSAPNANNNGQCMMKIDELGRDCNKQTQVCYLERDRDNQKVDCIDSKCQCKAGFKPSKDNLSCGGAALHTLSLGATAIALLLAKTLA